MGRAKKVKYTYHGGDTIPDFTPFLYSWRVSTAAIAKLELDGTSIDDTFISTTQPTYFGLSVDVVNNIYTVAGASGNKFNSDGTLLWSKALPSTGQMAAIDSTGDVYFSYYTGAGTKTVSKYDSDGNFLFDLGVASDSPVSGALIALDYDDNLLYTYANGSTNTLTKVSSAGATAWSKTFGSSTTGSDDYPIAVSSTNDIAYLNGAATDRLYLYDSDGNNINNISFTVSTFGYQNNIIFNYADEIIIVTSPGTSNVNTITKLTNPGLSVVWTKLLPQQTLNGSGRGLSIDTDDNMYVPTANSLLKYDTNGNLLFNKSSYRFVVATYPKPKPL